MAQVGGISVAEMNKLEIELCLRLNWELHIVHGEYINMVNSLFQPNDSLWLRWQHQYASNFSSDDDMGQGDAQSQPQVQHVPPPALTTPPLAAAAAASQQQATASGSKSLLPKWVANGFGRSREVQQTDALRLEAKRSETGAAPAASVSVR
jgi:hypothetical protein